MHLMALSDFWLGSVCCFLCDHGKGYAESPVPEEPLPTSNYQ